MEDLDSLLEDLGRGKYSPASTSTTKKPPSRPVSSRVDLNELEDLMEDLAAPTARPTPVAIPEPVVEKKPEPVVVVKPEPKPEPIVEKKPEPIIKSEPEPISEKTADATNVDDLEALMESLNMVSNKRASKRELTPISNARPPSTHNLEPSRPASVYNPPATTPTPVYTPPTPVYTPPTPVYTPPASTYTPPPASTPAPRGTSMGPTKGDELDRLLNNLTHQMDHIEPDNPASRGTCYGCKGGILGEMVQAMGKTYHPEHFTCGNCRDPLGTKNFYEQGGQPICGNCYQMLYCPKCAHCDQPVADRCITALGKKWHPEHFICSQCLKPFPNGSFFERDGRPYCETDFFGLFASKCGACQEPIKGDSINALGQQWHPEHFVCTYCGKAFGGSFFEHGGKPYCEAHYHQQTGSLCGGCGKAINGRSVTALDKKWHPEHFVCAFCMNPLAGGTFSEKNNKAYCKECHSKLFGN